MTRNARLLHRYSQGAADKNKVGLLNETNNDTLAVTVGRRGMTKNKIKKIPLVGGERRENKIKKCDSRYIKKVSRDISDVFITETEGKIGDSGAGGCNFYYAGIFRSKLTGDGGISSPLK